MSFAFAGSAPGGADLEVQMVGRRAAGPADRRDRLAGRDPVARLDEIRIVVGVDREEAAVVRDLDDATVAGLDAAHHDDAGCRRLDGRAGLGLDVDAGVPAAAPPAEGGGHGALDGPDEHPAELVRVGHSELEVLRDARARRPRRGPRGGALARVAVSGMSRRRPIPSTTRALGRRFSATIVMTLTP